jgi:hypothetical protein
LEVEQDLRAASDRVMRTLERLQELETEKRTIDPGTPRFRKLAREVERLAASVFAHSHVQQQLAEETATLREEGGITFPSIDQVAPSREIQVILAEWREAERRTLEATVGSTERAQAEADANRLRAEYRRTYQSISSPRTRGRGTS